MKDIVKAKKILAARRERAKKEYEIKKERIFDDEKFADDYRRFSYLRFEMAKRDVFKLNSDDINTEYVDLERKIAEYMQKNGLDNIDDQEYFCPICSDTGYVNGRRCECLEKLRIEVNLNDNPVLKDAPESLKQVDFGFYGKNKSEYEKYAKFLYNNFVKGDLNFCTLIGASGTGKTYLAKTCLNNALRDGKQVAVLNSVRLNRIFLEYHCAPLENKGEIWRELIEPDVLLIDDIGVESVLNNVTVQYFYELLTERADLKTVLTSNLDLRGLENKYGQRILSRLADKRKSAIIGVSGEDYRIN